MAVWNLSPDSASRRAARETDQTPVVTCTSDVSRVEPTSSMVLRSRTRGGRSSAAIEIRPETKTRPEPEIDNPAEIQVFTTAICEEGSADTRPYIPETASQHVTADKPETTAAFPASQETVVEITQISLPARTHCVPYSLQ